MVIVWILLAAFFIGWGCNVGVMALDEDTERSLREKFVLQTMQLLLIAVGLGVFSVAI